MGLILGHRGLLLKQAGGGPLPVTDFYSAIMALGPTNYWRNGEASGSVMVDEIGADGSYSGSTLTLGSAALYPGAGALPCAEMNVGGAGTVRGISTVFPPALTSMTLLTIIRPTVLSGIRLIGVQRDEGTAGRKFQWRSNGTTIEFINIPGAALVASAAGVLAINTTYLVGFEVDAAGAYTMYLNGVAIKTGTLPAGNYGGAGDQWAIGEAAGPAANYVGKICENVVFDKVLGGIDHAALFAWTGL